MYFLQAAIDGNETNRAPPPCAGQRLHSTVCISACCTTCTCCTTLTYKGGRCGVAANIANSTSNGKQMVQTSSTNWRTTVRLLGWAAAYPWHVPYACICLPSHTRPVCLSPAHTSHHTSLAYYLGGMLPTLPTALRVCALLCMLTAAPEGCR